MIGTLLKVLAYSKAPRTTFTMLHPTKAVLFRKFQWDMRHAYAPRITALGAAAVVLPVGVWLGRKTRSRDTEDASGGGWRDVWGADRSDPGARAGQRRHAAHNESAGHEVTEGQDPVIMREAAHRDGPMHSDRPMARGRMSPTDRSTVDIDGMRSANAMGPLGTRRMSIGCIDEGPPTG